MAGLTINSNTVTLTLGVNASADNTWTVSDDFTIVIPAGAKTELAGNAFFLTFDGDKQLLIDDQAGSGYTFIGFDEDQNILPVGTYLIGCVYLAGKVIIKVIQIS